MPELLKTCLIVCPFVFLAGFVDSVAGGGGLISLPTYIFVGLPMHLAAGTNKIVNCIGTAAAAGKYIKSGRIRLKYALIAAGFSLCGSILGTSIAVYLNDSILKIIVLCALPIVAVTLTLSKDFGKDGTLPKRHWSPVQECVLCAAIGFVIGCYDGIVGPGTGTFLIMAFTLVMGTDLLTSSGCAKTANLASNIASAVVWIIDGSVLFSVAVPAAACSALGNYLGAKYAIRGGSGRIRGMIFVVLGLMFAKLAYDLLV